MIGKQSKDPRDELLENENIQPPTANEEVHDHPIDEDPSVGGASSTTDEIEAPELGPLPPASNFESVATGPTDSLDAKGGEGSDMAPPAKSVSRGSGSNAKSTGSLPSAIDEPELLVLANESLARANAIAQDAVRDLVHRPSDSSPGEFGRLPFTRGQASHRTPSGPHSSREH